MKRPVTVYEYIPLNQQGSYTTPQPMQEIGKGIFHQWGQDCFETETHVGTYTTAIVEMEDGTVKNLPVELIRFEDGKT